MRRRAAATLAMTMLALAGCTPGAAPPHDPARGGTRGRALGLRAPLLRRRPADRLPQRPREAAVEPAKPAAQRPRHLWPGPRQRCVAATGRARPLHGGRQRSGHATGCQRATALYNLSLWRRTARAGGAADLDVVDDRGARLPGTRGRPQLPAGLPPG